jgi:hypothetical protein
MKPVIVHFKESAKNHLKDLGLMYQQSDGELDVILEDVPYTHEDDYYEDPDEQFCAHYGINYDLVYCIELA